jgi:hypothetical protein
MSLKQPQTKINFSVFKFFLGFGTKETVPKPGIFEYQSFNKSVFKIEFLVPNFLFYWRVTSIFHKNLFLELFFKGFLAVFKVFHEFLRVFELIIGNCVYFCHVLKNSKANIKNGLLYFLILSSSPEVSIPDSYKT